MGPCHECESREIAMRFDLMLYGQPVTREMCEGCSWRLSHNLPKDTSYPAHIRSIYSYLVEETTWPVGG